jgi:hypothetical protein
MTYSLFPTGCGLILIAFLLNVCHFRSSHHRVLNVPDGIDRESFPWNVPYLTVILRCGEKATQNHDEGNQEEAYPAN